MEDVMKTIAAGQFKAQCLAILDDVAMAHDEVVVTKHGKPIASVVPCKKALTSEKNPLKNSILFEDDIVSPVSGEWGAEK
jgi:prevent-host-death family protein